MRKPKPELESIVRDLYVEAAPFCSDPFDRVRVTCEGDVFMCGFQRQGSIGSLLEDSLEDVWFGKIAEEIRQETLKGVRHPICRGDGCPHAWKKKLKTGVERKTSLPKFLEIDLPNYHCNVGGRRPSKKNPACLMCERALPGYQFQTENRLPEILPRLSKLLGQVLSVQIQGVAEAFWEDYIFEVLDLLEFDAHRKRIRVVTTTNGILLNQERRSKFLERCPLSTVAFSLDSAKPETYRQIRRLDAYDRVIENLMAYSKERRRNSGALLQIHNNINLINLPEGVEMVRVAARAEVDCLVLDPTAGPFEGIVVNRDNVGIFKDAQTRIEEEARKLGVRLEFLRPLDLGLA